MGVFRGIKVRKRLQIAENHVKMGMYIAMNKYSFRFRNVIRKV